MKTEITRYALLNCIDVLNKFSFVKGDLGLAVAKTKDNLEEQFLIFKDERQELMDKYGVSESGEFDKDSESYMDFAKELIDLANKLIEVEIFTVPKESFKKEDIFNPNLSALDYELFAKLMIDRD